MCATFPANLTFPRLDRCHYIWQRAQAMKLLILKISQLPIVIPLGSSLGYRSLKYSNRNQ
jgi:hypothetical protein